MRKVAITLVLAMSSMMFSSCEADDAAVYSEDEIVRGNMAMAQIVETAFVENNPSLVETSNDNIYYYIVDSQDDANAFVEAVTCGEYSEGSPVYVLPAGFGSVSVAITESETTYYKIDFDIVDYSGIRYILTSGESI